MISIKDLNPKEYLLTLSQEQNLSALASLLTVLEDSFRKTPGSFLFTITSGFRSIEDQYRIYRAKGIENPPLKSAHLTGEAADISDPLKKLQEWLLGDGLKELERLGLYCEEFSHTPKWAHIQSKKPHSGNRYFLP